MKIISFSLAVVLVLQGFAYSQDPRPAVEQSPAINPQLAEKARIKIQKRGVGEKSRVTLRLCDRTEVKGYISQIEADTFQVTDWKSGQVTTVAYQDVTRIRGGGMSTGAKVAIGAGVVAGAMIGLGLGLLASGYRD
jgi:hypothetical protein